MPKTAMAVLEPVSSEDASQGLSYDTLFVATTGPMLIADARSGSIIRANAAAAHLFGISRRALAGMPLPKMLESRGSTALWAAAMDTARMEGVARVGNVRVRGTALDSKVRLSLVRAGKATYVLVHFLSLQDELALSDRLHGSSLVYEAVDRGETALVVTDLDFNLLYANKAFLHLIEVDSLQVARAHELLHWLQLSAADLSRMRTQMTARKLATTVSVRLRTRGYGRPDLQALAIAVPDAHQPLWGFSISERPRIN